MPDTIGEVDFSVGADGGKFLADLKVIGAAAERIARSQGRRLADALNKPLERSGSRLGRIFTMIFAASPFIVSGISAMAGAVAGLGGSLMNTIAAGAAFIPVLGALGAAAATSIIAFQGMGDALDGDKKAMKALAPEAQKAAKAILGLKGEASGLRKAVQGAFFKGLADDITRIGETLLPVLQKGLVGTAQALNPIIVAIGKFLTAKSTIAGLNTAFSGTNSILATLGQAAVPMLQALLTLYNALLPAGQRLAGVIASGAAAFAAWAEKVSSTGQLAAFMDRAQDSAGKLWSVLKNLTLALFNVFDASSSAGDSLLDTIDRVLVKFLAFTSSAEGKSQIAAWAAAGTAALEKIGAILSHLAPLFTEMAKPELFNALLNVIDSTAQAFATFAPVVNAVVKAFADMLNVVAPILGPLLAFGIAIKAMMGIARIIGFILKFTQILRILSGVLSVVRIVMASTWVAALGPVGLIIAAIAAVIAIVVLLWNKFPPFRNAVLAVWAAIQKGIAVFVDWVTGTLVPALVGAWEWVKNGVTSLWTTIVNAFNAVVSAVTGFVTTVVTAVVGFASRLLAIGLTILDYLTLPFRVAVAIVVGVVMLLWNTISPLISNGVSYVVGIFQTMWNTIVTIFNAVRSFVTGVWSAIYAHVRGVVNNIRSVVSAVFNAVRSVINTVLNAIRSVVMTVWNAVRNFISTQVNNIRSLVSAGFNAVLNLVRGPVNQIRSVVSTAFNNMVAAIRGFIGQARAAATSVGRAIIDTVKGFVGQLAGVGRNIVQGLINGITGMAGALAGAIRSFIANNVPGPIKKLLQLGSPSRLMEKYGKWTGQGLENGLISTAGAIAKASSTLGKAVADGYSANLASNASQSTVPLPTSGGVAPGSTMGRGGDTFIDHLEVVLSLDDLERIRTMDDFLKMISAARVTARKKPGTVSA